MNDIKFNIPYGMTKNDIVSYIYSHHISINNMLIDIYGNNLKYVNILNITTDNIISDKGNTYCIIPIILNSNNNNDDKFNLTITKIKLIRTGSA